MVLKLHNFGTNVVMTQGNISKLSASSGVVKAKNLEAVVLTLF